MKKRLLTILCALVSLMGWAQIEAPTFTFEGDNLVMSTEAMNASIFYGIADLPDLTDETVESVQNSLISLPNYYDQPIELKGNVVVKAITVRDEGGTLVQSDTTTLVYGYTLWVELSKAITRGNSVYNQANGNPAVDESLLDDLKWAVEEGEMIYGARGSAPYFEAEHFANTINDLCDQIEAQMGIVPSITTEPYAVLSDNNTVLTFYYDDQKAARNGMSVGPFSSADERGWNESMNSIQTVVFDASFADCTTLTSTASWFYGLNHLNDIANIQNLKTNNVTTMFAMFYGCYSMTNLDLAYFNTENVTNMERMFYGCSGLYFLDLSSFNTANVTVTTGMFSECSSLASIIAGNANIPAEQYAQIANPNLLVYVNEASVAPEGIQNVVIDGQAKEIILKDVTEGNNNWYCPQPFTAEKISYTRTFLQQTKIGVSRGWESIALPFKVQEITHETRGEISPFTNYQSQSMYHFWLRRLTYNGLQSVQEIDANTPYIISMPNSSEYAAEYNLAGKVTFSAQNAYVPETETMEDESADFIMVPLFIRVEKQPDIYALNVGEARGGHPEGSVFEKNYREVRPFEAFTMHFGDNGSRFMSIADMLDGGVTGIEELKDGKIEEWKSESWYDLNGRRVLSPSKGVFIQNGKKIVVK